MRFFIPFTHRHYRRLLTLLCVSIARPSSSRKNIISYDYSTDNGPDVFGI
jgi:hypothetical protein